MQPDLHLPVPSETVMAPGEVPPLPETGTLEEMTELYLETVGLYGQCEDKRDALSQSIRDIQLMLNGD